MDAGLKVTIRASGTTLKAAGMLELREFEGAAINRNDSRDAPGYFHLSISRGPECFNAGGGRYVRSLAGHGRAAPYRAARDRCFAGLEASDRFVLGLEAR